MPIPKAVKVKVATKKVNPESGMSRSDWNKMQAEQARADKAEKAAKAEAARLLAEKLAWEKKSGETEELECKDLSAETKPKMVSRVVAKALGIPNNPEKKPPEVLKIALKKMPDVVPDADLLPKEQLLVLAGVIAERKEAKLEAARAKKAKKEAENETKLAAAREAKEAKEASKRQQEGPEEDAAAGEVAQEAEPEPDLSKFGDEINPLGVDRKALPDMRQGDVVQMKVSDKMLKKQKKLSKRKGKVNKKKANKKDEVEDVIGADGHLVNTVQARLAALRAVTGVLESAPHDIDVKIAKYSMAFAGPLLINECSFELTQGCRYGLIGENGSGKTNFINSLACREVPIPDHIDMYHLHQEADPTDATAVEALVTHVEEEVARLDKLASEIMEEVGPEDERLTAINDRLDELDPTNFEANARKVLSGLGFDDHVVPMDRKTKHMSGGWRMRVSLGQALFAAPSILLLDEPTNHLDLEACIWLEEHLAGYKKCLLVVSHSQDFLNAVCNKIVWLELKTLTTYSGNYSMFLKLTEQEYKVQVRAYEKQCMDVEKLKEYVAKNKANKKTVKSAQSKQKVLDKIMENAVLRPKDQRSSLTFSFLECHRLASPVLPFDNVTFCYSGDLKDGSDILYKDLELGVDCDSRIALVGPNGSGKSTLLKLMAGELTPTMGNVGRKPGMVLGRYNQHSAETLNMDQSPLDFFKSQFPTDVLKKTQGGGEMTDSMWRAFLGAFGITGHLQTSRIGQLSDGQKSRLVLARMRMIRPNILLLDEPTNHLDVNAIDGLARAIGEFNGGVVLVSHDFRLIDQIVTGEQGTIWECTGPRDGATIRVWPGTIQEYKRKLARKMAKYQLKAESAKAKTGGAK